MAMGLPFVSCSLEPIKPENLDVSVAEVEESITGHCLLLPYIVCSKRFAQEYAVIFDDWDVGTLNFEKTKMTMCLDKNM